MKISEKLEQAINAQINLELQSSYDYLALAAWLETTPYSGFASWMRKQSVEENEHAMKFFDYLNDRGGRVALAAVSQPSNKATTPLEAFRQSLDQEQSVTKSIHALYELAEAEKDWETRHFLSWFLQEQVEEEKTAQDMIDKLELVGENASGLLRLDVAAGARA